MSELKAVPGDQHTLSAKQMVAVMLNAEQSAQKMIDKGKVSLRPLDIGPTMLAIVAAQSRALAFILDELLTLRGEDRTILFRDEGRGNGKVVS